MSGRHPTIFVYNIYSHPIEYSEKKEESDTFNLDEPQKHHAKRSQIYKPTYYLILFISRISRKFLENGKL